MSVICVTYNIYERNNFYLKLRLDQNVDIHREKHAVYTGTGFASSYKPFFR